MLSRMCEWMCIGWSQGRQRDTQDDSKEPYKDLRRVRICALGRSVLANRQIDEIPPKSTIASVKFAMDVSHIEHLTAQ